MAISNATEQIAHRTPRSAIGVARRSLVLAAVVCCGGISSSAGQSEAEDLHHRVLAWLTHLGLWDEAEPSEEKMLRTFLADWEAQSAIEAVWNVEGLAVLAWALDRFELPRHDEQVNPYAVADAVGFLSEDVEEVIITAKLRRLAELKAYRELMYAIHSRLRDFDRNRKGVNFTTWVDKAWIDTLRLDASHLIVHDDLAIGDKAISEVKEDHWRECEQITRERHRAIIWLFGEFPSYSHTPVDT